MKEAADWPWTLVTHWLAPAHCSPQAQQFLCLAWSVATLSPSPPIPVPLSLLEHLLCPQQAFSAGRHDIVLLGSSGGQASVPLRVGRGQRRLTLQVARLIFFFFLSFFLFRAAPVAYGSSQARGRIRAAAAGLQPQPHSNTRSGSATYAAACVTLDP